MKDESKHSELRDKFAIAALTGLVSKAPYLTVYDDDETQMSEALVQMKALSRASYFYADSMLAARKENK